MTYEEKIKTARYLARVFFEYENNLEISEKPLDLSWDWVYGMAKRHFVEALIFDAIGARAKLEAPEALYLDWSRDASLAGAKHIAQRVELEKLSAVFSANGIPFMPLKGFLIKELYKSPALRQMTDIDIFVGRENLEKISALLLEDGYTLDSSLEVHDSYKKLPFIEIELHKILHRSLSEYTMLDSLPTDENQYRRKMSDEDFLIFLLHHAKKHDETGGVGMRTVFDFYLIFKKKNIDETSLLKRLRGEDLLDFYKNLRSLIALWFEDGEKTPQLLDFEIYTVTGGVFGNLENAYLRQRKTKGGVALFFERVFPPYSLMSSRYPVLKKCPILLPFFYPVRIVASIFNGRAGKNASAVKGAARKERELEKLRKENADKL